MSQAPRYRRSRHLVLYWSGDEAVLLNAHTLCGHAAHPNLIAFLSKLTDWSSAEQVARRNRTVGPDDLVRFHEIGLLETEDEAAAREPTGFEWDPMELAVHRRTSRGGYWPDLAGPVPPVIGPRFADQPATALPPPGGLRGLKLEDALGGRRSVRRYAGRALGLEEVSTLLYHSARVVKCVTDAQFGDRMLRPFPTAGARSELETYVVSVDIRGLEPGAFYYDASRHRLLRIRVRDDQQERILRSVHQAAGGKLNRDPALVLLITAVFERMMWKYRDLGLSLIYKDVGSFFQTLYLVATALNLAPCAIGSGDEAENSRWLGLDPLRESQVGCFVCGPRGQKTREPSQFETRGSRRDKFQS
jgi:SagB-type dehydrogenase family enzyme